MLQYLSHYGIWILSIIAMVVNLVAMIRRQLLDEYSLFFWYMAAHALNAIVALVVRQAFPYKIYFYVYWGWEMIDVIFTLIVLQFVFVKVFDSYKALRGLGVTLFRWTTVVLCIFAIASAIYAASNAGADGHGAQYPVDSAWITGLPSALQSPLGIALAALYLRYQSGVRDLRNGRTDRLGNQRSDWIQISANLDFLYWPVVQPRRIHLDVLFCVREGCGSLSSPPSSAQLQQWNDALAQMLRR